MGITFNDQHSDNFGVAVLTEVIPVIPNRESKTIKVLGRDGGYVVEGDYKNKKIELTFGILNYEQYMRRLQTREIANWLSNRGSLVLDGEPDKIYNVVKTVSGINSTLKGYKETFKVDFICSPFQEQTYYNDDVTWERLTTPWSFVNIPWDGYKRKFYIVNNAPIELTNVGTYECKPIIKIEASSSDIIHIGDMILTGVSDIQKPIFIDCENQLVYNIENNKKILRNNILNNTFLSIKPGLNIFEILGSEVRLDFNYKNVWR